MHNLASLALRIVLGLGAAGAWMVACSTGGTSEIPVSPGESGGHSEGGHPGGGPPGGGAGQAQGGNTGGIAGTDPFGGNNPGGSVSIDAGTDALNEGCATVDAKATRIPLSIYITLDRSSSLSGAKWDAALTGLNAFLTAPSSAGVNVGLVTFPRQPLLNPEECNFSNYKAPEVAFDKLPANAKPIQDFLATVEPTGFGTPLYPALGGALERGVVFKGENPKENFAVLLVTDGAPAQPPTICNGIDALSPDTISTFVADVFDKYGVKTFVIGLPGIPKTFAENLAQKGGTQAIVIQQDVDLAAQFQKALAQVQGEGLGCEFPLPPDSSKYDKDAVNVRYTKGDESGTIDLDRSVGCKAEGWDYDNDAAPTKLILCGATCAQVKNDGLAKIDVVLGCPTRIK